MSAFLLGRLTSESGIPLPLGGRVSCGFPSPAADYQNPDLSLDQLVGITPTSSVFLFLASGDSMIGAGIHDSDILVVEKGRVPKPGEVVLAIIGAEFLVKRFVKEPDGSVRLVAENDRYPPVILGDAEVLEVWGVCAWVLHRL